MAGRHKLIDILHTKLQEQAVAIDQLEAWNAEQREVIRNLHLTLTRLQIIQRTDSEDLVHLARKLLARNPLNRADLDAKTVAMFRRRGWIATDPRGEA